MTTRTRRREEASRPAPPPEPTDLDVLRKDLRTARDRADRLEQRRNDAVAEAAQLRAQVDCLIGHLKGIAGLQRRLNGRPADWYVGSEAVERAAAALKELKIYQATRATRFDDEPAAPNGEAS